jgi:four helix bundle protein
MVDGKINSFEDLVVWQETQNLAVMIYELTQTFPASENYGLISQMKRAVASISANIAEGFGRRTPKDKLQFFTIAYGSLLETKNFVYLGRRLGYVSKDEEKKLLEQVVSCQKLLNAYMRSMR